MSTQARFTARAWAGETPFIGRQHDLERLAAVLDGERRLVTVLGTAGMGKTRLVKRFLDTRASDERAIFCSLAMIHTREDFLAQVMGALRPSAAISSEISDLQARIEARLSVMGPALIVLDNLEQLVEVATPLVRVWMARAPQIKWLVTSRRRLGLSGELLFELEPLSLPLGEAVEDSEALALLVERAGAVGATIDIEGNAHERDTATQIVTLLDGIPLAIELAAARMRILSLTQLLERLSRRFKLLRASGQTSDHRWETLWAAIEWSWQLLAPHERACLVQCAFLPRDFSLECAEAAVDLVAFDGAPEVMDVFEALRDHSLLRSWSSPRLTWATRFGLFESVREFAQLKAGPESRAQTRERCVQWAIAESEAHRSKIMAGEDGRPLDTLLMELDHFTQIARWALEAGDRLGASRILIAASPAYWKRGPYKLYNDLLEDILQGNALPPDLEAQVLYSLARLKHNQGLTNEACDTGTRALGLAREHASGLQVALIEFQLGGYKLVGGQNEAALEHYERAREIFESLGNRAQTGRVLSGASVVLSRMGRLDESRAAIEESLKLLRASNNRSILAMALNGLCTSLYAAGRHKEALEPLTETIELAEAISNYSLEVSARTNVGIMLLKEDPVQGEPQLLRAMAIASEHGLLEAEASCCAVLAVVNQSRNEYETAVSLSLRANAIYEATRNQRLLAYSCANLMLFHLALDRVDEAQETLDKAIALAETLNLVILDGIIELRRGHMDIARGDLAGAKARYDRFVNSPETAEVARRGEMALSLKALHEAIEKNDTDPGLTIEASGGSFCISGKEPVSLGRRRAARRILAALAHHRVEQPGESLSVYDLMDAGWPGEELHPEAGANRVYVVLNDLRKLGLKEVILNQAGGYLLDPAVETGFG